MKIYKINNTLLKSKNVKYLIKTQLKSLALHSNNNYGSNIIKKHQIFKIIKFDKSILKKVINNVSAEQICYLKYGICKNIKAFLAVHKMSTLYTKKDQHLFALPRVFKRFYKL